MPTSAVRVNDRYSLPGELEFREGPAGLLFAEIHNDMATATVCLQGAQLTTWRPLVQKLPVVWASSAPQYTPGKSIRGGIPICWPWFGPHASQGSHPSHGFARTLGWAVRSSRRMDDGQTQLSLELRDSEQTRALWPNAFHLEARFTVGASLQVELLTTNCASAQVEIGEALHTYFQVGDIESVRVVGLDACEFVDKVDGGRRLRQEGAVAFHGEVDRVYLGSPTGCAIEDPLLRRRIRIESAGSGSAILWTPWADKAAKMGDLGAVTDNRGGWREMLCVESGNAMENTLRLAAGATHRLAAHYLVEAL